MVSVALVNQKGGVGKTTVALGLAASAAARGLRVVVVDLDPQANATSGLGVWNPSATVDQALQFDQPGIAARLLVPSGWDPSLFPTRPQVLPSSPALAQREPQLATDPIGAQDRLAIALEGLDADVVVIDCPPSLGLLTVNGLFAADRAVIVTEPGAWATDGVDQILRNIRRISERRGGAPEVAGIVVNRLARTRDGRYWDEQLVDAHPELVVRPAIRLRAAVTEAAAQSLPIHALPRDGVAEAVREFDQVLAAVLGLPAEAAEAEPAADPSQLAGARLVEVGVVADGPRREVDHGGL